MTTTTTTKIELTDETMINEDGVTLYRVRIIEDIPTHGVKKGDLGGWVESLYLENGDYRIQDNAWVHGEAQIYGNARVSGNAWVSENTQVIGNAWVSDNARLGGHARVYGDALINGDAWVSGDAQVCGRAQVSGESWVAGDALIFGSARVDGHARVVGDAWVSENARVSENAEVAGDAWVSGRAQVSGNGIICSSFDYFVMENVGAENSVLTLARTANGHSLSIGRWENGTLDTLMSEVEERSKHWDATEEQKAYWLEQYRTAHAQCAKIVESWDNE